MQGKDNEHQEPFAMGNNRYGGYAQGNSGYGGYGNKKGNRGRRNSPKARGGNQGGTPKGPNKSSASVSPEVGRAIWVVALIPVAVVVLVVSYFTAGAFGAWS